MLLRPCLTILALLAGSAEAHERPKVAAQAGAHDPLECYCRAKGRIFAPGETICLATAQGLQLAECRMEINVMSWSLTPRPCPES